MMKEFLRLGFNAITVCVDAGKLDASFAGRLVDASFLRDLPEGVDPCGENGEFHTFCFDGPVFSKAIPFILGKRFTGNITAREIESAASGFVILFEKKLNFTRLSHFAATI